MLYILAAFPSVAHAWLRRVFLWMGFPTVCLWVFEALLALVFAMVDMGGPLRTAFAVRGGVI